MKPQKTLKQSQKIPQNLTQLAATAQLLRAQVSPGAALGLILMLTLVSLVSLWNLMSPATTYPSAETPWFTLQPATEEPAFSAPPTLSPTQETDASTSPPSTAAQTLTIYISGAVKQPGLYELTAPARVNDAVQKAGGLTELADPNVINLATHLVDGDHVQIPEKSASPSGAGGVTPGNTVGVTPGNAGGVTPGNTGGVTSPGGGAATGADGRPRKNKRNPATCLDLRTATAAQLETLPGIGPKMAEKILAHRAAHGLTSRADLLQIRGIGMKTYQRLAPQLCP